MRALYKGSPADVWEIGKLNSQPDWVKKAFEQNYLVWYDDRLKILLSGINPSAKRNIKLGVQGIFGTIDGFGGTAIMADIGDYVDITNGIVMSKKNFLKHYTVIT